jgi:MFS transporter, AAHS family, 4-hydroxybenzoate transporter
MYALTFWVPTLLASFGFTPEQAPLGSAAIGAGGFVSGLVLVPLTAWFGARRVLGVAMCAAVALIVTLSRAELSQSALLFVLGSLGGCLISGTLGQIVLAVAMYPASSRTAGVGWSAALGRAGSIIGPAVGGALISMGQSPREVLFTLCFPIAIAAVVAFAMKPTAAASA